MSHQMQSRRESMHGVCVAYIPYPWPWHGMMRGRATFPMPSRPCPSKENTGELEIRCGMAWGSCGLHAGAVQAKHAA